MIEMPLRAAGIRERWIAEFVWVIFVLANSISGVDNLVDHVAVFARDGSLSAQTNCIHDLLWPDGDGGRRRSGAHDKTRNDNERNTTIQIEKQTSERNHGRREAYELHRVKSGGERRGMEESNQRCLNMQQAQTNARAIVAG